METHDATYHICASCGARVDRNAEVCDLCGTPVDTPEDALESDLLVPDEVKALHEVSAQSIEKEGGLSENRYCGQCGKPNPLGANYCNWCGNSLTKLPTGEPASTPRPVLDQPASIPGAPSASGRGGAVNRQVLILIIVSVIAVVALFGLSVWSQRTGAGSSGPVDPVANTQSGASDEQVTAPAAPPLAPEVAAQAQALEDEIAATDDESLVLAKRRELVELYAGAGRLERAGDVQEELAATLNTAEAWAHAGNLHFDWMEQQPDGTDKIEAARQAIDAYTRALELDPDNLDVRTDRAVAYLNDPENPMRAIQETNLVLEADPSHPQANFNRGVMLTLIGRYEDAIAQYQRVQEITEPGSRVHEEARRREDQLVRATAQPQGQ